MSIYEYIEEAYNNANDWFVEECKKAHHLHRIAKVIENKRYLTGYHKILNREDMKYKGKIYKTSKMILQTAKTILQFHTNYLIGKRVSLIGSENMVKEYNKIFRKGKYHTLNYKTIDKVVKYGDCYEYVYIDSSGKITSKLINPEDGYPIYDDMGEYVGFIEYYTIDNISYYTVYYGDKVERYSNSGEELELIEEAPNATGLVIHYKNGENEEDDCFGRSMLEDIKPILSKIEFLLNKMDDAIYTHSLSPIAIVIGQRIEGSIDADTVGYLLNLEDGAEFKYAVANLDSASIKMLYDALLQQLMMIASVPSHVFGQSNIANVSEVSLELLYQLATSKAGKLEAYIREGLEQRFEIIESILNRQGIVFGADDYVDVEFNYSKPTNQSELLDNLKKQREMGAMSIKTIIEKSDLTLDVQQEIDRLMEEGMKKEDLVSM
ncbi:phage portal protein [Anaerophilus nitritogenes]|uniref:phage portal protein n=1 Tax=Anaerophilus nitritogenes TaxID=2498136 RepID=UPI00101B976E|nr:phage portal protein [Anaerophilus nitritogenes]